MIAPSNPKPHPVHCPLTNKILSSIDKKIIEFFQSNDQFISEFDQTERVLAWIFLNILIRPDFYSPNANIEMVYYENNKIENATYLLGNLKSIAQSLIQSSKKSDLEVFLKKFYKIIPNQIIVSKSFEEHVYQLKANIKYKDIHPFYRRGIDIVRKDDILNRQLLLESFLNFYKNQKAISFVDEKRLDTQAKNNKCSNSDHEYYSSQSTSQLFYQESKFLSAIILFHSELNLGNQNIFLGETLKDFTPRLCYLEKNGVDFFISSVKGRESDQVKSQFIQRIEKTDANLNHTLDVLSSGRWTYFDSPKRYLIETKKIDKKKLYVEFMSKRLPIFHLNSIGEINLLYNSSQYSGPILDERSALEISCHTD
ncbi:MAG: hypothetical protein H6622_05015 [Halobacteriovoraceae bacterium]|nr:hypothetical protein [Halobacteriovoraceae bacterium]